MEIIRIPTTYYTQLEYLADKDFAYVLKTVFSLCSGNKEIVEKSMRGGIVISIYREAIQMENKARAKKGQKRLEIDIATLRGDSSIDTDSNVNTEKMQPSKVKEKKIKENKVKEQQTENKFSFVRSVFLKELINSGKEFKDNTGINILENIELIELFQDFIDMRKEIKSNLTKRAMELLLLKCKNVSLDYFKKQLEQSIENSWKGIFELKQNTSYDKEKQQIVDNAEIARKERLKRFEEYKKNKLLNNKTNND